MKLKDLFEDNVSDGDVSSNSQFFKTYDETKEWLDRMGVENYEINKDTLVVDVGGGVNLSNKSMNNIPVKFGKVGGMFNVAYNRNLKSLVGCPDSSGGIHCNSIGIKNFNGLGHVKSVVAYNIESLVSFYGLPNKLEYLRVGGSCHNVNSLDHFPKIIENTLFIGPDFKWADSLYKHMDKCNHIYLNGALVEYNNIMKLLYIKGVKKISSYGDGGRIVTDILNAEIQRQPDPRKRNLLKVAQELSNAGFHYLTIM